MQESQRKALTLVKTEKERSGKDWQEIAALVNAKFGTGYTGQTLSNQINRGTFKFALALEVLAVLEVKTIDIPEF